MSLQNFIPVLWSARLLENIHNTLVYGQLGVINRDYEGEIRQHGDTVKINTVGEVSVGDYIKNTDIDSPENLEGAQTTLTVDQSKYINFQIDDVDRAQQFPKIMDTAMGEAAFALANTVDTYIAAEMVANAAEANRIGDDTTPRTVGTGAGESNAYNLLVDMSVLLDDNNCPANDRWIIVPPWFHGMLRKDERFVSFGTPPNRDILTNGVIGRAAGFDILQSNKVPNTSGAKYKIVAGHGMATTFAQQLVETVAYRPERRFADAVKSLMVYGSLVVRPKMLSLMTASKGT